MGNRNLLKKFYSRKSILAVCELVVQPLVGGIFVSEQDGAIVSAWVRTGTDDCGRAIRLLLGSPDGQNRKGNAYRLGKALGEVREKVGVESSS